MNRKTGQLIRIDNNDPGVETVKVTLHDVLTDITNGEIRPNRVLIILVDDEGINPETGLAKYNISQYTGGMNCSQCISALEIIKMKFLKFMGMIS